MYEVVNHEYAPENIFAGDFPVKVDTIVAGGPILALQPVTLVDGRLSAVTADSVGSVYGIAGNDALQDENVVVYLTGEFQADAISLPEDVTLESVKTELRKISIFVR